MNVRELKELLNKYPEDTMVGIHVYDVYINGEEIELAEGVEEGFTDRGDIPIIYIY